MTEEIDIETMDEGELRIYAQQQAEESKRLRDRAARAEAAAVREMTRKPSEPEPSAAEALKDAYSKALQRGTPQDAATAEAIRASTESQIRAFRGVTRKEERAREERELLARIEALRAEE